MKSHFETLHEDNVEFVQQSTNHLLSLESEIGIWNDNIIVITSLIMMFNNPKKKNQIISTNLTSLIHIQFHHLKKEVIAILLKSINQKIREYVV